MLFRYIVFYKQKVAYGVGVIFVGSDMCIRVCLNNNDNDNKRFVFCLLFFFCGTNVEGDFVEIWEKYSIIPDRVQFYIPLAFL